MNAPDPTRLHPVDGADRVVFLRPLVKHPRIEVGDYTYYDDFDDPLAFESRAVLYGYGPERLVIGRFCAIASGAGNPARVVRARYEEDDVERLLRAAWWNWPIDLVTEHARTIMSGTPAQLEAVAAENGLI